MSRLRLAVLLGVLAALGLAVASGVAVAAYRHDEAPAARPRVVTDPASGATFRVPAGWEVHGQRRRVSYGAVGVRGPALLGEGYCRSDPRGSFRALAGFTDASFAAWVDGVRGQRPAWSSGVTRRRLELADGTPAVLAHTGLLLGKDACSTGEVDVAMVTAGDVRVVVVADTGEGPGTLERDALHAVARTLELP